MQRLDKVITLLEQAWMVVATLMLLAIMLVSTLDVGLRYAFNSPLGWSYDLISIYLMSGLFFFALSDTLRCNDHVCVDLLHTVMTPRQRHAALILGYALASVVFALMIWPAFQRTVESWRNDDVVAGSIGWPTWVSSLFVTLGFAVIWLRIVFRFVGHSLSAATGREVIALPPISGTQEVV
ncbi:TRAP transporter small permease subunit [Xanthobacter sp. DSM 24535]|uniref:TRAP transporter small permease n=1 Tax=Roseixanthobacter psychrophilus TaxID=3119917 RepID=UPI003726AA78